MNDKLLDILVALDNHNTSPTAALRVLLRTLRDLDHDCTEGVVDVGDDRTFTLSVWHRIIDNILGQAAPESFAGAPLQIGEIRCGKSMRPDHWTPREVLVRMLRAIDAGEENPSQLAIVYVPDSGETPERETNAIAVMNSSKGIRDLLGMLYMALGMIQANPSGT